METKTTGQNKVASSNLKTKVNISEFSLQWDHTDDKCEKCKPQDLISSTHEMAITPDFVFVSGQNMHQIAKFDYTGKLLQHYRMPHGSGPHSLLMDTKSRLWVSFEFLGKVVRLHDDGKIAEEIDVQMHINGSSKPVNPAPHGITLDADGETIWFTGKRTSTIGKINPDRSVEHFQLDTLAAMPIYLCPGPDKNIWGTELLGNKILRISGEGMVDEFPIPTPGSRPIVIIPDPVEPCMWFSEEAGVKIGKITMEGKITEYAVPVLQKNDIIAGLTFDSEGNIWVQVYVDHNNPKPAGKDYLIRIDKSVRYLKGNDLSELSFTIFPVPTTGTMMHRIRRDYKGNLWFTEMMADKLGRVEFV